MLIYNWHYASIKTSMWGQDLTNVSTGSEAQPREVLKALSYSVFVAACVASLLAFCFSYKEESDNATDSDDVLEWTTDAVVAEKIKNDYETIEKIIRQRIAKKGGRQEQPYFFRFASKNVVVYSVKFDHKSCWPNICVEGIGF